jgi:gliding motility-associated-like protein
MLDGQTVVCIGSPLELSVVAVEGVNYFWSGPSFSSTETSISVENPQSGAVYSLWAENKGCFSKDTIEVTVILQPVPMVDLGPDVVICNGSSITLNGPEDMRRYLWSNGDTASSSAFGPGLVVLTVRNIQGCSATDSLLISGSSPEAAFSSSPAIGALTNMPIAFTDNSTGAPVTWQWNFGNGQNAVVQNPVYPYPSVGTFTVTLIVTDANGCTDTTSADYVIANEIAVPNSFTPNGDGKNDFFVIKGLEGFPESDLKVFNRWGSEVYDSNAYQNNWDGGDSPDGVYYYVLRLKNAQELKGDITLKRQ